jgi:hypothetical protein
MTIGFYGGNFDARTWETFSIGKLMNPGTFSVGLLPPAYENDYPWFFCSLFFVRIYMFLGGTQGTQGTHPSNPHGCLGSVYPLCYLSWGTRGTPTHLETFGLIADVCMVIALGRGLGADAGGRDRGLVSIGSFQPLTLRAISTPIFCQF